MYEILEYEELDTTGLKQKIEKLLPFLKSGDFKAAQTKKLKGTPFYRARIDETNRLLFRFAEFKGNQHILLLEVIRNHNYARSRFLSGAVLTEQAKIDAAWQSGIEEQHESQRKTDSYSLRFVNQLTKKFHYLDKPLCFDAVQNTLYAAPLPLIIVGSAGSGKSAVILERIKTFSGKILYVTLSPYLVELARNLYFSDGYENEDQQADFFSFRELLESTHVPNGREVTYQDFWGWYGKRNKSAAQFEPRKVYEEIKGVITGTSLDAPALTLEKYQNLGIKQSIFIGDEKPKVYGIFEGFCSFLKSQNLYDLNVASFFGMASATADYDFVCVDEVQDFTTVQLALVMKLLKTRRQFVFCGDSNQIVHPNFFSWARVKSYLYQTDDHSHDLVRVLEHNYRNTKKVTELANQLLKIKSHRFGSIDKESNFLVKSDSNSTGEVEFYKDNAAIRNEINNISKRSTQFAIVTLSDDQKKLAREIFQSPLVFTVHEAKGLEYPNVVLFNIVSSAEREFKEIAQGVDPTCLSTAQLDFSRAKDKTDKTAEGLKFYINGLYVALTRSTQNIYWIEAQPKNPLLVLLPLQAAKEKATLKAEESSMDDWQKEARKLELQGKAEQANDIRRQILKQEPPPWKVQDLNDLVALVPIALDPKTHNKKAQRTVFEMAFAHNFGWILERLIAVQYTLAANEKDAHAVMGRHFYGDYTLSRLAELKKLVFRHGVNFQNPLGERPLAIAIKLNEPEIAEKLLEWGAAKNLFEPSGKTPLGGLISKVVLQKQRNPIVIEKLYSICSPSNICFRFGGRLQKIDAKAPEFFFLILVLAMYSEMILYQRSYHGSAPGFDAATLADWAARFPDSVVPPWRKKRTYISSLLSKHEADKFLNNVALTSHSDSALAPLKSVQSKGLFLRVRHGQYLINPALEFECNEEENLSKVWRKVADLFPYAFAIETSGNRFIETRVNAVKEEVARLTTQTTKNEILQKTLQELRLQFKK